jgi:hypothetical protein
VQHRLHSRAKVGGGHFGAFASSFAECALPLTLYGLGPMAIGSELLRRLDLPATDSA